MRLVHNTKEAGHVHTFKSMPRQTESQEYRMIHPIPIPLRDTEIEWEALELSNGFTSDRQPSFSTRRNQARLVAVFSQRSSNPDDALVVGVVSFGCSVV